jgi:DNA modification methylase
MESKLVNGDSLEVLKEYDEDSVDLLCTDPPYGYGFMGKSWDKTLPPKDIFRECFRVLKPGSFAFVMSAPRSDVQSRMVQMLEEVGFEVGYTPIYWAYATGFPKAMNIGKAVDKRLGKERKVVGKHPDPRHKYLNTDIRSGNAAGGGHTNAARESGLITAPASDEAKKLDGSYAGYQPKPAVEVVIVAMKPLDKKGYVDQALDNQKGVTWLDDARIPFAGMNDKEQFDKDNVAAMMNFDGKYEKGEGKMYEGGWEKPNREGLSRGTHASRKSKSDTYERVSACGDTEQSETKDGRNLWGKKATKKVKITKRQPRTDHNVFKQSGFKSEDNDTAEASPLGRFAANLLVSDNVLDTGKKTKSSGGRAYQNTNDMFSGGWAYDEEGTGENPGKGDEGDFSRYYSLDEWWKSRISKLPDEVKNTFPFFIIPKASKSEKNMGLDNVQGKYLDESRKVGSPGGTNPRNRGAESKRKNFHPTVKPIQLFSYLIILGSRKKDVVLDPFMGSGTTPISCVISGRNYIGIEREEEYFEIAESRVENAINPSNLVKHDFF